MKFAKIFATKFAKYKIGGSKDNLIILMPWININYNRKHGIKQTTDYNFKQELLKRMLLKRDIATATWKCDWRLVYKPLSCSQAARENAGFVHKGEFSHGRDCCERTMLGTVVTLSAQRSVSRPCPIRTVSELMKLSRVSWTSLREVRLPFTSSSPMPENLDKCHTGFQ